MTNKTIAPVSVVIPCYRCASTINRALLSVFAQTQKPAEVILVDDASGDETLAVLRVFEQQYLGWIKVIALAENQGAASARNAGWAGASQAYLAFLDADDAWHPRKIEIQYAYMQKNPDVMLSGHDYKVLKHNDLLPSWGYCSYSEKKITKWMLFLSNSAITSSMMLMSNIPQRFVEKQRYMEDHMLWMTIVSDGGKYVKLLVDLTAFYKEPYGISGLSSNLWLMERSELYNYIHLYKAQHLGLSALIFLETFSLIKFLRRLVIVGARKAVVYLGT